LRKALRRSLENKNSNLFIIFLSDEQFAGKALPDRLLFERSYFCATKERSKTEIFAGTDFLKLKKS